jgi:hypothetical protein
VTRLVRYQWCRISLRRILLLLRIYTGLSRLEVLHKYAAYTALEEQRQGTTKYIRSLIKPALGLFSGVHNGKLFRQRVDANVVTGGMTAGETLLRAAECLSYADTGDTADDSVAVAETAPASGEKRAAVAVMGASR